MQTPTHIKRHEDIVKQQLVALVVDLMATTGICCSEAVQDVRFSVAVCISIESS
ncbi:unnamed protein product [Albugo candida]|uniref:Uncharacterized protein n=1 Tax=Albugo candida TaxID=65357 RepID=A0A024GUT0_9STRA|nr:unnamed protein product [Albugo candida]|eukprot:CCI50747.1 unnamed protein product [Albugo candida]